MCGVNATKLVINILRHELECYFRGIKKFVYTKRICTFNFFLKKRFTTKRTLFALLKYIMCGRIETYIHAL